MYLQSAVNSLHCFERLLARYILEALSSACRVKCHGTGAVTRPSAVWRGAFYRPPSPALAVSLSAGPSSDRNSQGQRVGLLLPRGGPDQASSPAWGTRAVDIGDMAPS